MNLVLVVFCKLCCKINKLALLLSYVYFDMFLENILLKNVSSNDADSIRDLRFILNSSMQQ